MAHRYPLLAAACSILLAANTFAFDTPTADLVDQGFGKAVLDVTAGPSGAPYGFSVWWMTASDYASSGWIYSPTTTQLVASFTGTPTLNTWGGAVTTFVLGPNESVRVEIGDLQDETGVWSNFTGELDAGVSYVFCASANDPSGTWYPGSLFSTNESASTPGNQDCVYTQGYWKNHTEAWPVASLNLGSVSYDQAQLLAILLQSVEGNGLVFLLHQLIATKLNIANGADPSDISTTVAAADGLIGSLVVPPIGNGYLLPRDASLLTQELDDYNNGITGPGHCLSTSVERTSWGSAKARYLGDQRSR